MKGRCPKTTPIVSAVFKPEAESERVGHGTLILASFKASKLTTPPPTRLVV